MENVWVEKDSKLIKAMENIEINKAYLNEAKRNEKKARLKYEVGLMGAAYIGARVFIGPDIMDNIANNFDSFLCIADITAMFLTFWGGIGGGLDYADKHEDRKKYEKDFKKAKFEYWKFLGREYPIARRTLKNQYKNEK